MWTLLWQQPDMNFRHKWLDLTGVNIFPVHPGLSDVANNIPDVVSPTSDISVDSVTSDVSESTINQV